MPEGIKNIYGYAFYSCSSLQSIDIPNSVTNIGSFAFYGCSSLPSVTIPNGVDTIGASAFGSCSSLYDVKISQAVCSSQFSSIFTDTYSAITNVVILDGVGNIGDSVFSGCISLQSIDIPNTITNMEISAFSDCASLVSFNIQDDNPHYSITNNLLCNKDCTEVVLCPSGLTDVNIPDCVTNIAVDAFVNCSSITNLSIGYGLLNKNNQVRDLLTNGWEGYNHSEKGFVYRSSFSSGISGARDMSFDVIGPCKCSFSWYVTGSYNNLSCTVDGEQIASSTSSS